jgi:transcriptional regulator of aromatic amino acid metabolism
LKSAKMGKRLPDSLMGRTEDVSGGAAGFVEGVSASMRPVEAVISELSQSDVPVLLLAEPGAGKHATARRIHEMSRRSAQPFRRLQCSTLNPEELAVPYSNGGGTIAGGTIFLEELADLSSASQAYFREALLFGLFAAVPVIWKSRSRRDGCGRTCITASVESVCDCLPCGSGKKTSHC